MAGPLTFGRYQLLERVAAGGMGEVWVGLQTGIGRFERPVAVKLLLPHLVEDERLVKMFLQEARLGAQLSHANVVQVFDVGFEHDRYFIVMELVRGVSLSTLIAGLSGAQERLPADVLAYVGRCLCDGLHVAHEQKGADGKPLHFVHRDVTPHNVLISTDGAVKLTDFGIARVAEGDRLSRPGLVLGKLSYLSPEQLLGQPVDARTDVFAAGATLFHLAALEKPFEAATGPTLDPMRLPLVPLRVLRPDLPKPFAEAIERAMHPELAQRFSSARELRNALPVPSPEAPELLGALIRRVCAAALIDLETKTERATVAVPQTETERHAVERRPVEPPSSVSASALPTLPRDRRGPIALLVLLALAVGGGVVLFGDAPKASPGTEIVVAPPSPPAPVLPQVVVVADSGALPLERGRPLDVARPSKPGFITLEANPWAEVSLDGKPIGETPLADVQLPAGMHSVVFKNPESGKSVKRPVQVHPGQHVSLKVDLR
jgi:serine/threonine-protein kinase